MNEFDDRHLASTLARLGGEQPDDNVAYAAVLGKVRRARRRRAVALTGGSMLGLVLLATSVAVNTGRSDRSLRPATENGSVVDDSVDVSRPVGNDTNRTDTIESVATTLDTTATSIDSPSTNVSAPASPSTPDQTQAPSPTSPPSSPATTPATAPATTATFSGVGGSITVRLQNGTLSLVGTSAAGGFSVQVNQGGGQRVEVVFRSDDHETRVRVDVSGGSMDPDIDENDSAGDDDGDDDGDGDDDRDGDGDSVPDETDD
jgi:cytoskeletal protein RodZ